MEVFILMVGVCACDLEADEDEVGGGWQVVVAGESGSERITIPVHSSYYMYEPRKTRSKPNASDHPDRTVHLLRTAETHLDHSSIDSNFLA